MLLVLLSGIPITIYDPVNSSTSSAILCSDERCSPKSNTYSDNQSTYDLHYGDGSGTSGYYVSDLMHFRITVGETDWLNTSALVLFGEFFINTCSTSETGQISQTDRTLDGIMGLGRQSIFVIFQLSSQGIAPNSFAHCLPSGDGGGILAFGTPVMPNLVFTPLVKSM
uniref:Peptidase A1 domain-containing protein n=1 Tax=Lactuca sativa TaxID=4236 RepID=A0A9R1XTW4_LACSA|nr:hypothetical protein LSAT_V11C100041310 [Lactuca sativa]